MRFFMALFAAALLTVVSTVADARPRYKSHRMNVQRAAMVNVPQACTYDNNSRVICLGDGPAVPAAKHVRSRRVAYDDARIVAHPAGCPRSAFCGCGASVRIFGKPVRELFLAANWRKFPPAACAPGNAAWRYGHVFAIEQCNGDGTVVAYDANSGRRLTRIHTVSLQGYRVVNPHGARLAAK